MLIEDREAFMEWAESAVAGLKSSIMMIATLDDRGTTHADMEYALQIGHCILTDKPIIVVAPHGTRIPDKLRAVATAVVIYDPLDFESAKPLIQAALRLCVPQ